MIEELYELTPCFVHHIVSDEHVETEHQSHHQKKKNDTPDFTSLNSTKKQRANHRRNQHEQRNAQHADIHDIAHHWRLPFNEPADREGQR